MPCSETYQFYDLPFCRPADGLKHKPETLGEVCTAAARAACAAKHAGPLLLPQALTGDVCGQVVDGNRLIETPYDLSFRKDHEHTLLCKRTFTAKEVLQLRKVRCAPAAVWTSVIAGTC